MNETGVVGGRSPFGIGGGKILGDGRGIGEGDRGLRIRLFVRKVENVEDRGRGSQEDGYPRYII